MDAPRASLTRSKRRGALAALCTLVLASCFDFTADLETCAKVGKCVTDCTSDTDCAGGQTCDRVSGRCAAPPMGECPWPAFPPVPPCGNDRDLFLAADGLDTNPGTRAQPKKTLAGLTLLPGDRVHLAEGTYSAPLVLQADGTAECPISVSGAPDGGTVFRVGGTEALWVDGASWRVSHLRVEGGGDPTRAPVRVSRRDGRRLEDVRLRHIEVHLVGDAQAHLLIERCSRCVVEGSAFTKASPAVVTAALQAWSSSEVLVMGNRFSSPTVLAALETRSGTTNASVIGNVFRGGEAANFDGAGAVFARNLVLDMPGGTAVQGASEVSHNTFLRLGSGLASASGRFSGNLVSLAGVGRRVVEGGGYNLFNAVRPSSDGGLAPTDLVALPKVDAEGALLDESPAIDAADPSDPVPPGGGARADIGALERGAVRLADGRYCLAPDAGW